jgi:uncharacterized protein YndB with AHSA1/START domain
MTETYGAYESIEDQPALRFERRLSHPIDVVWPAITESPQLESWFPCQVEVDDFREGAEMRFRFEDMSLEEPSTMTGRVTAFDPPRRFAFYWGEDHLDFELEPLPGEDACVLRLTVLLDSRDKASRDGAGWHVCLDRLERLVGGEEGPAATGNNERWRELYDEYQRRGVPAGAEIPAG